MSAGDYSVSDRGETGWLDRPQELKNKNSIKRTRREAGNGGNFFKKALTVGCNLLCIYYY